MRYYSWNYYSARLKWRTVHMDEEAENDDFAFLALETNR
jgi:hypothetical protein